jgi:hypothetical protein
MRARALANCLDIAAKWLFHLRTPGGNQFKKLGSPPGLSTPR